VIAAGGFAILRLDLMRVPSYRNAHTLVVGVLPMACLLTYLSGHRLWAIVPYALGLLSKETTVVVPIVLLAAAVLLERRDL